MAKSVVTVASSSLLLTRCVVTINGKVENAENLMGPPGTRGVFGCAAHGHAVKGDSTHVCYAEGECQ